MKRIIFLLTFTILSFHTGICQSSNDNVLAFASEASKFEANTSRNRATLYQDAYTTLDNMMQQEISNNKSALTNTTGTAKTALADKIKIQEQYYGEIKVLSVDMVKNRVSIKSKLDQFRQTL